MSSGKFLALILIFGTSVDAADFPREKFDDSAFETVFDGKSLSGWHVSTQTGHSGASMHTSGGKWNDLWSPIFACLLGGATYNHFSLEKWFFFMPEIKFLGEIDYFNPFHTVWYRKLAGL